MTLAAWFVASAPWRQKQFPPGRRLHLIPRPSTLGKNTSSLTQKYEECLSAEFWYFVKNMCDTLSKRVWVFYHRWTAWLNALLNQKKFCQFRLMTPGYEGIYFEGSFNVRSCPYWQSYTWIPLNFNHKSPVWTSRYKIVVIWSSNCGWIQDYMMIPTRLDIFMQTFQLLVYRQEP